jgi:steroid 5-alpha reductase family enzyme
MFDLTAYLWGFAAILAAGLGTWLVSLIERDVSIVDSLWSIMFLIAAVAYAIAVPETGPRTALVLVLTTLWAVRLSAYITWRNWGEAEDRRYQAIRRNNEPRFGLKSLYIVFGLQGTLAWVVSLPLLAAVASPAGLNTLDYLGVGLWLTGIIFEAGGDFQLARFKAKAENRGQVMDRGLWRYTRHPNYFGNFCIWWGFYFIAFAAGGWWAIVSPLLMTFLLLRVSGVALLEKDISERRPAYRDYSARTNAFFPGPPRQSAHRFVRGSPNG